MPVKLRKSVRSAPKEQRRCRAENASSKAWFWTVHFVLCPLLSTGTWVRSRRLKITVSSWSVADWWWDGCLGTSCLCPFVWVKNSGFSQPPVPCSLAAFLESAACTKLDGSSVWRLLQVIVHSPQQETSNQMPIRPGRRREHPQKFGLNNNHAFGTSKPCRPLQSKNFSKMGCFRKADSPRAKRRVHYGLLESPLAGFGKYTSCQERLSKKLRIPALHL